MRNVSLALVFALRLAAQNASVEGLVVNAITGAPVPRAHVWLQGGMPDGQPGSYRATSGVDGKFTMPKVTPGNYSVLASRVGFAMKDAARDPIVLKADDKKTDLEIRLNPCGVITGRVVDADGEPVEGASVSAEGARSGASDDTDAKGQFRLGGLAPGRYRIRASAGNSMGGPPETRTDGTAEAHYATAYFPGFIRVRAGAESSGAEVRLVRVPFVRVSGKVIGLPADAGAQMMVQGETGRGVSLPHDGRFVFWRLDPGKYRLRAEWNAPDGSRAHTTTAEIEVAASNIDGIELRVVPDAEISGRLEFVDERARAAFPQEGVQIQLLESDGEPSEVDDAVAGADGRFVLKKVPPAKYKVRISGGPVYVKSAALGPKPVEGGVIDFSNGAPGEELSLMLGAATGSVSGVVEDDSGKPVAAQVVLVSADESSGFEPQFEDAQADGKYAVDHLPPGDYRIVAVPRGEAVVPGLEDLMESVAVRDDEKVVKNLRLRSLDGN